MDAPKIPGYDILASLPQGGMSAVFKARQISLDRVVVLKMLPPSMASDGVDIDKFLAEAKITAQLKHPNIVQVYDFGKSPDGIYYFVMEFVSGYSVAEWIRRKTSLSVKDALLCAHCVAEALNYAWGTFGVVHCDIKPDNIMIDGDGTVKVADLGLARSVRSVMDGAEFGTGLVVGTPYYISPEQSQGRLELDCRADIYSLGAMLYHCLTGKLPFEGLPPLEVMDCQITDRIPDLMELKPQASLAVACLIEKMMAKNPGHRQKDWPEVIRDMLRARSEILPEGPLPPDGASTMQRCPARAQRLHELSASGQPLPAIAPPAAAPAVSHTVVRFRQWMRPKWLASAIVVIALAVPCLFVMNMIRNPAPGGYRKTDAGRQTTDGRGEREAGSGEREAESGQRRVGIPSPERSGGQAPEGGQSADVFPADLAKGEALAKEEALAQHRLEAALQWQQANPDQFDEAIRQFEKIAVQSAGTRYAQAAQAEIARIRERKRAAIAADMQVLRDNVQPLLERQKWREAAARYEQYEGRFKAATVAERTAKVREWLERDKDQQTALQQAAEARKQEQSRQWQDVLNAIAADLVEGNAVAALTVVRQASNNTVLSANRDDLRMLAGMLAEAGRADQRLLDSFRSQKDREVVVALTNGPERLLVRDVQDDTILVEKVIVVSAGRIGQPKTIRLPDLSFEEKKARLGTNPTPDTALAQGLVAVRDGNLAAAKTAWSQAGPFLSAPLTAKLRERKSRQEEAQARSDFILLLRSAQLEAAEPLPGCEACLTAIDNKKYSSQAAMALAKSAAGYQAQYGQTAFAQAYAPALEAFKQRLVIISDSEPAASATSAPTPAGAGPPDGAAVRNELFLRNPGLTELNISLVTDDAGKIVRAELIALDLKDISPLARLPDLRAVVCAVMRPDDWRESSVKAPLSDLSPLKGLPLRELCVSHTRVKDLAPLGGLPLTKLDLTGTRVTDLSALKGMPLRELTLSRLNIRDLKPLAGMPLEFLNISHTDVSDLAPLSGMQLRRLIANASRIHDIKVLTNMPLAELNIGHTEVGDISALAGMKLGSLNLGRTRVRDLSVLAGMPLRGLNLSQTNIRDLSPLRGLSLESLSVRATRVRDLDPLRDMPLRWLDIGETDLRDLSPLRNMPLKGLTLQKTAVRDLSPIQNTPIEEIWLDYNPDQDTYRAFTAVLLRMPRLQKVNGNSSFRERRR